MSEPLAHAGHQPARASLLLKRGALYIDHVVYERYLAGLSAVILLRRESDLLVLPVRHAAAGGYLLKVRNAAGDRVVDAVDFFREHGRYDAGERWLSILWSTESAGLLALGAFGTVN